MHLEPRMVGQAEDRGIIRLGALMWKYFGATPVFFCCQCFYSTMSHASELHSDSQASLLSLKWQRYARPRSQRSRTSSKPAKRRIIPQYRFSTPGRLSRLRMSMNRGKILILFSLT